MNKWSVEFYNESEDSWVVSWMGIEEKEAMQEFAFATYQHKDVRLTHCDCF